MNLQLQLLVKAQLEKLLKAEFIKSVKISKKYGLDFFNGFVEKKEWEVESVYQL
jgi:hypothetical protein